MTVDLIKYADFVDEVTSQASKDAEYFCRVMRNY